MGVHTPNHLGQGQTIEKQYERNARNKDMQFLYTPRYSIIVGTLINRRGYSISRRGPTKKLQFFFRELLFWKIWLSKSGYRHLRRPKSLPRMRFSSLYDASPARTINFCVLLVDFGRKKTSHMGGVQQKNSDFFSRTVFFEDLA